MRLSKLFRLAFPALAALALAAPAAGVAAAKPKPAAAPLPICLDGVGDLGDLGGCGPRLPVYFDLA